MSSHLQGRDAAGRPQRGFRGGWAAPRELCPLPYCPEPSAHPTGTPSLCVCKSWHSEPSLSLCSCSRCHQPGWDIRWHLKANTFRPRHPTNPSHTTPTAQHHPSLSLLQTGLLTPLNFLFYFLIVIYNLSRVKSKHEPLDGERGLNVCEGFACDQTLPAEPRTLVLISREFHA